ncbi:hypothetical protein DESC_590144 [Desulfosarcina cetonica]|nr:hypothetical protein DESC_590144 [Desulfosarcina cetonica]
MRVGGNRWPVDRNSADNIRRIAIRARERWGMESTQFITRAIQWSTILSQENENAKCQNPNAK